jgi:nitrilase
MSDYADSGSSTGPSRRTMFRGITAAGLAVSLATLTNAAASAAPKKNNGSGVVPDTAPYTVAVVTAAAIELDLRGGVDKAVSLIGQAAGRGAKIVAFGELWLTGFPEISDEWMKTHLAAYAAQSLVVGGPEWQRLSAAARDHGVMVEIGYAKRAREHLYMGQAVFGSDGTPLIVRRKIRPSGGERALFSDDPQENNIEVVPTRLGRVGALSCWEHLRPYSTFNMLAQRENVHFAAWPYNAARGADVQWWEDVEVALSAARMYAITGNTYVLLSGTGYGAVFSPLGQILAETQNVGNEDLLLATINPSGFTTESSDPEGEFSWGVLQTLRQTYPGRHTPDTEHGTLNKITIPGI